MTIQLAVLTRAIGANVRQARSRAGLSRRRLAVAADVSERYLNELEKGEANASVGILLRIADALHTDFNSLIDAAHHVSPDRPVAPIAHRPLAALLAGMSPAEQAGAVAPLQRFLAERRRSLKGIALLGLRGAGKSTIGELFAHRHGLPFVSVTRNVEARAGMSLNDLFNLGGSEAYRSLENEVVRDLANSDQRIVLETAGGIVANGEALDVILGSFRTVWLKAAPEEHLARVAGQGDTRPMRGMPQALEHLKTLLAQREPEYARAESVLDTSGRTPEACLAELERITAPLLATGAG
jgi:XRE family aerobic/anaerobic benzoate catabolism transcriptional regulator